MAEPVLLPFSASTDGKGIKVAATGTAGTLIHTNDGTDERVFLYAQNNHTAAVLLSVEYGGVASPDDLVQVTIPAKSGAVCVVPGWPVKGSKVIRAFAATANVISIFGGVSKA